MAIPPMVNLDILNKRLVAEGLMPPDYVCASLTQPLDEPGVVTLHVDRRVRPDEFPALQRALEAAGYPKFPLSKEETSC